MDVTRENHCVPVRKCFYDPICDVLKPDEKQVDFILDIIWKLNAKFRCRKLIYLPCDLLDADDIRKRFCPSYNDGSFNQWEDVCIKYRWQLLMDLSSTRQPDEVMTNFASANATRRSLLGCFLGQDLNTCRSAMAVFNRAVKLICPAVFQTPVIKEEKEATIKKEERVLSEDDDDIQIIGEVFRQPIKIAEDERKEMISGCSENISISSETDGSLNDSGRDTGHSQSTSSSEAADKTSVSSLLPCRLSQLCPIQDGFSPLRMNLMPDRLEVDRVVKFIIDKNINVRFLNTLYCDKTGNNDVSRLKSECPDFRYRDFSLSENIQIQHWWFDLIKQSKIQDPLVFYLNIKSLRMSRKEIEKRNVFGCYFGQDMKHVRLASEIFRQALETLKGFYNVN